MSKAPDADMNDEENTREFIVNPDEDEWPYGFTVFSHLSHDSYQKPAIVESWPDEETAIHCGRIRHEEGYVVHVYRNIAFTVGRTE
jgi:hypothetical protein